MQIDVHDDKKLVCIWLSHKEADQMEKTEEHLKTLYAKYKKIKYHVAVFQPGHEDVFELTSALLKYNRRLFAEREVQAEKERIKAEQQAETPDDEPLDEKYYEESNVPVMVM